MKRSDMLEVLEEAIHDNYDYCVDAGPSYCYDEILSKLEEAGMLPPTLELLAGGERMPTKELLDYSEIDYELGWDAEECE